MLQATRSLHRIKNVNNLQHQALSASVCSQAYGKTRLPKGIFPRFFSTFPSLQKPSSTQHRPVSVFLPQDGSHLKPLINDLTKTASNRKPATETTSVVTTHHDLASYLRYHALRRVSLSDPDKRARFSKSTVFLGTRYEYLIQRHLQNHMGFDLTRVGGKGDGGIDLIGTWTLPKLSASSAVSASASTSTASKASIHSQNKRPTFRVLCQAKRLTNSRKPMPALMRELEGTLTTSASSRALQEAFIAHQMRRGSSDPLLSAQHFDQEPSPPSEQAQAQAQAQSEEDEPKPDLSHLPTLGILLTTRPLTEGIERAMANSRRPLMYVFMDESSCPPGGSSNVTYEENEVEESSDDGEVDEAAHQVVPVTTIRQIAWNAAAARAGLDGYDVVKRYSERLGGEQVEGNGQLMGEEAVMAYNGRPVEFVKHQA